jgi:hypothetical protein
VYLLISSRLECLQRSAFCVCFNLMMRRSSGLDFPIPFLPNSHQTQTILRPVWLILKKMALSRLLSASRAFGADQVSAQPARPCFVAVAMPLGTPGFSGTNNCCAVCTAWTAAVPSLLVCVGHRSIVCAWNCCPPHVELPELGSLSNLERKRAAPPNLRLRTEFPARPTLSQRPTHHSFNNTTTYRLPALLLATRASRPRSKEATKQQNGPRCGAAPVSGGTRPPQR